jgi:hypothetical protein
VLLKKGTISMNRRQFLGTSTLILAGALSACGTGGGPNQDLAKQFLTERNGGTPVAIGAGGPNAPILGFIESVDGPQLTVKREMQETTTTVQLATGAKIHKYVDAQLSEIKAGDTLTAFGTKQDDVFQANLLRLGGDDEVFSAPVVVNRSSGQNTGGPPATGEAVDGGGDKVVIGGPGAGSTMPMTGTVETVESQRIVLKDKDGASTAVKLADDARIQKSAEVALADLTVGTFILAIGTQSGDVYQATQVQILPAPQDR